MDFSELKRLSVADAITIINKDLEVLYKNNKRTDNFGKSNVDGLQLKCSWSSIHKYYGPHGYRLNRDTYKYEYVEGLNNMPQDVTIALTKDEIQFVKELYKQQQQGITIDNNSNDELKIVVRDGAKKTTGISVYVDTWQDWTDFKAQYPYSGTDVLDQALKDFMAKYNFKSKNKEEPEA